MNDGEDWIMRPVAKQLCKYESLIDGTLDLKDIARMNDCLDAQEENERRQRRAER